jgi:dTMP kinase
VNSAGKFISLEGIEGAGKSTLARALQAALVARGLAVTLTREPGGTPLAERLRALLLERGTERISAEAETLLMFAARAVHMENLIRPALASGSWVICDRFTDATRAYQGAGRGVDAELIERVAQAVHGDLWPHRTLVLDLPVPAGMARARHRTPGGDRFEDEDARFFERVRARYLALAKDEPVRVRIVDATADPDSVAARALQAIADLLPPSTAAATRSAS